jgi:hypothetical protein
MGPKPKDINPKFPESLILSPVQTVRVIPPHLFYRQSPEKDRNVHDF